MSVAARVIAFVGLSAVVVAAQPTQPIYLQYDGFVRNADNSLTLAFGYYNLNQVDVTIEAGDDKPVFRGGGQPRAADRVSDRAPSIRLCDGGTVRFRR